MRVYNSFIVALALAFTAITVVMAAYKADKLDTYYSAYTIALLVLVSLYMYFNPKARRALGAVSLLAFAGFGVIVLFKVVEIL
jgi:hypothetical protein